MYGFCRLLFANSAEESNDQIYWWKGATKSPTSYGVIEMAKRSRKSHNTQAKLHGYVVVTFADDIDQARDYESLLKSNDIPVEVTEQTDQMGNCEIAVMVPDEFLDESHVIIESQDAYDDFYDLALDEDEDELDFDSDVFEDDF